MESISIFWHRRDLRLHDNIGLTRALEEGKNVVPIFIFDSDILNKLSNKSDARVQFIHDQLARLKKEYLEFGATLFIYFGKPIEIFQLLNNEYNIEGVYTNHDYEPYARKRDGAILDFFVDLGIPFKTSKDHVFFERLEVCKDDGKPYTVFTPYANKWKAKLSNVGLPKQSSDPKFKNLLRQKEGPWLELDDIGFSKCKLVFPSNEPDIHIIQHYSERRDIPSIDSTSRLGIHLRFGTISIREMIRLASSHSEIWLKELIWRDFYMMILWNFPKVVYHAFKPAYDRIPWVNDELQFTAWCEGKTGYPLVDAGMRELNETGFMHNRVRMVAASFLVKHLLIDWRWGEAYFSEKLLDFELASNNGGWQWAASSGCDAAPYFRVFNPELQFKKFDPDALYVKRWVREFGTSSYPNPIVEHKFARNRVIETYKAALN